MNRKFYLLLSALLVAMLVLAACGGGAAPAAPAAEEPAAEEAATEEPAAEEEATEEAMEEEPAAEEACGDVVTISYLAGAPGVQTDVIKAAVDQWNAENPGISGRRLLRSFVCDGSLWSLSSDLPSAVL